MIKSLSTPTDPPKAKRRTDGEDRDRLQVKLAELEAARARARAAEALAQRYQQEVRVMWYLIGLLSFVLLVLWLGS